ncbi:MAG: helix-turn-helix transcriptional regulator [Acidimicrobiales bacterium]
MSTTPISVIPPTRLGALLRATRERRGLTLEALATGSAFSVADLARLEAGGRALTDREVDEVLRVYGIDAATLVPERTGLIVDLADHELAAGGQVRTLAGEAPTADEVLATYLSLVYTLRHAEPGTPLTLREADVSVLSRALQLAQLDVERRLQELMVDAEGTVLARVRDLRRRLLLPAIGVVVAATAIGTLLFVQAAGDQQPASDPTVEVGPAAEQSGEPGPAGPVVVVEEGIPVDQLPEGAVNLGEPQIVERGPDGSIRQSTRQAPAVTPDAPAAGASDTTTWRIQEGPVGDLQPGEVRLGEAQTIENPDAQP